MFVDFCWWEIGLLNSVGWDYVGLVSSAGFRFVDFCWLDLI